MKGSNFPTWKLTRSRYLSVAATLTFFFSSKYIAKSIKIISWWDQQYVYIQISQIFIYTHIPQYVYIGLHHVKSHF